MIRVRRAAIAQIEAAGRGPALIRWARGLGAFVDQQEIGVGRRGPGDPGHTFDAGQAF
jgi:hypothetical protein